MNKGTLVLLPGIVRGMGQEAEIEVLTRRVQDHNASGSQPVFKYVDCTVIGGPTDLPDGDYIASFAGFSAVMTLHRGLWMSPGIAVPDGEQPPSATEDSEAEPIAPQRVSPGESKADPPALKTSTQDNVRRSYLV